MTGWGREQVGRGENLGSLRGVAVPTTPHSNPAVRRLRAQVAASTRWSREDPNRSDGPLPRARAAFDARFYEGIPDDVPPEERERRAAHARKAYFASLSLKSLMKREAATRARQPVADDGGDAA
jgi:hypothetical protein